MLVTVEDGVAVKVAGDPAHPITAGALCAKVNDYVERVYSDDRLLQPLIRTGPKGAGEFRPASWDEALDLVAERLTAVREEFGGEAVLPWSYMGTMGYLNGDLMSARFLNKLGATHLERTICAEAGIVGSMMTNGPIPEVDPELWPQAKLIVLWGWNPLSTSPHLWHLALEARKDGGRIVVVDPYRSRTARVADLHVRPLPGTDGALALGMMRAMVDAGVHADAWCREHATGYDDLLRTLEEWTVERAAAVTGVDGDVIRQLGVDFATAQPSLVRTGVGAQRHAGAPIAYRTIACIPALAGSWQHPGGGYAYIPIGTIIGGVQDGDRQRYSLRPGAVRSINMSSVGAVLNDPDLSPPVKAMVVWNGNPARVAPDATSVVAGLAREDLFTVVVEQFMTDTARYADVVLPATTQLEHLDAQFSWGHHYVTYNAPSIAPRGEAKPNTEIFRLLAARMGFTDDCFQESDEDLLASVLAGAHASIDVEQLRTRGWAKVDLGQGPTPMANGTVTVGGPVPHFVPSAEIADEALAERFPFALLTPKTHFFLNSTFANQARQRKAQGRPFVAVHPDDAARCGVTDGQSVRVWNDRGAFVVTATVSDDTIPGVLVAPMGWWHTDDASASDQGPQATTSQRLTAMGNAPTFNDNRVALDPA